MAIANGTLVRIYVNGSVISCEVSGSFESSYSLDKVACKDTPNGEGVPGPIDFSFTGEALFELSPSGNGPATLGAIHLAKSEVPVSFIASEAGGMTISAPTCRLTNFSINAATEESARYNVTFTGSGDYTIS